MLRNTESSTCSLRSLLTQPSKDSLWRREGACRAHTSPGKASRVQRQPCVPPVSVHPWTVLDGWPSQAEQLLLAALSAGGACLA